MTRINIKTFKQYHFSSLKCELQTTVAHAVKVLENQNKN